MSSTWMIRKNSAVSYAHVLLDTVTVVLQQCVTIEETAGSYKVLLETYNKCMQKSEVLEKLLLETYNTCIQKSEALEDSLQNLRQERAYTLPFN